MLSDLLGYWIPRLINWPLQAEIEEVDEIGEEVALGARTSQEVLEARRRVGEIVLRGGENSLRAITLWRQFSFYCPEPFLVSLPGVKGEVCAHRGRLTR